MKSDDSYRERKGFGLQRHAHQGFQSTYLFTTWQNKNYYIFHIKDNNKHKAVFLPIAKRTK